MAAYLLVLAYGKSTSANQTITIIHFTMSLVSPVASAVRAFHFP